MKRILTITTAALLVLSSCIPSLESEGDKFNKQAQQETNIARRNVLQKAAWDKYRSAISQYDNDQIPAGLKNKFLNSSIDRIHNIKVSGGIERAELIAVRGEIDQLIRLETVDGAVADRYVEFLMEYADTLKEATRITESFNTLTFAQEIAATKELVAERIEELKGKYAEEMLKLAQSTLEGAKKDKDTQQLLRADYYARLVLHYDSTNSGAVEVLKETTPALVDTYRAYQQVFSRPVRNEGLDEDVFKEINKDWIFMRFGNARQQGRNLTLEGVMINDANNAIRVQPEFFTLTTSTGQEIAPHSATIGESVLQRERETELTFNFRNVRGRPYKIEYKMPDDDRYSSTKYFYYK